MDDSDSLSDIYIRRSITLLRAAEGEALAASAALRKIHKKLIAIIKKKMASQSKKTLEELQVIIEKELSVFYNGEWPNELSDISQEVITREIAWNEVTLLKISGKSIIAPRPAELIKKAAKRPYQGRTFNQWVRRSFPTQQKRINAALKKSFSEGDSIATMTRAIGGITGKADADVRTITRSFFMHNATEAKTEVFKKNPKIIEHVIWISTLDSRTTPLICGIRDQLIYTVDGHNPIGHDVPWKAGPGRIHWNCRSTSAPKVRGVTSVSPRPSVGAGDSYKRGDNKTRTGRVRRLSKAARDKGIYETNIRTTRTRYEGWLKEQSKHNIDFVSDVLGSKEKARAFRNGEITLAELGATSPVIKPTNRKLI